MHYFVYGFITAIVLSVLLIKVAHNSDEKLADDCFKLYFYKSTITSEAKLYNPKYKTHLRGPMADDIYIWLTKGLKGDREDEQES